MISKLKFFIASAIYRAIPRLLGYSYVDIIRNNVKSALLGDNRNIVLSGPFAGMLLRDNKWWGSDNKLSMLLGVYEKNISEFLVKFKSDKRIFVDIGCADGYYAVGVLKSNLFPRTICYDISPDARRETQALAVLNGVSERIEIRENADENDIIDVLKSFSDGAVILFDIEGAEFDIFTDQFISNLKNVVIIIELHEFDDDMKAKADNLISKLALRGDVAMSYGILDDSDLHLNESVNKSLFSIHEVDLRLALSEGRPYSMRWICVSID